MTFNRSPLEQNLDDKLVKFVRTTFRKEAWFLKVAGSAAQRSGVPDYIICIKGKFVAIETKREDGSGRASGQQKIECRRIQQAGGIAIISDDFKEIKKLLLGVYKSEDMW